MTVQYFVRSAREMGMVDLEDGVSIDLRRVGVADEHSNAQPNNDGGLVPFNHQPIQRCGQPKQKKSRKSKKESAKTNNVPSVPSQATGTEITAQQGMPEKQYCGKVLLALPEDTNFLSPLRCFLRQHVCAFTTTNRDIAIRTPFTFSVREGQVGVGCIHCLAVPPKQRSNRAVCFPFTVARIYQSVADIQRFHLGECRMMPPEVRAQFLKLQSESAKGSRGLATRTYWTDSAKRIGLADGPGGMYFARDPSLPPPPIDLSPGTGGDNQPMVADNDNFGKQPLVMPEDRPTIAEFLFLVMEQLRPCRFTDADRNKRRSKNVGSIGVECKHCAGKIDGRKFFWSSVSAAESNFVSVHSHALSCKYIPEPMKVELTRLKALRREQTSRLKTGSQKAFFTRVWARLHGTPVPALTSSVKVTSAKSSSKTVKKDQQKKLVPTLPDIKEVSIDAPAKEILLDAGPLGLYRGSHDSDDIRALLESKSTLSSMPSVDDESIVKHAAEDAAALEMDIGNLDSELKTGQSSESGEQNVIKTAASKSSLGSVALNLSAVSVHCKEDENKGNVNMTAV